MASPPFTALTGGGSITFDSPLFADTTWHYWITAFGNATILNIGPPSRYAKLGWIAFFEHNPSSGTLPPGDYLGPAEWLEWEFGMHPSIGINSVGGVDGLAYFFYDGVEANIFF